MTPPKERRRRDRALADACIRGSRPAWETLVQTHHDTVRFAIIRTLCAYGRRADDATVEDLESALFLGLMVDGARRLRQYRGDASLAGWLRVMAANRAIDHLRRRRPATSLDAHPGLELSDGLSTADVALEKAQLLEQLRAFWDGLPEADRDFVELFFVQELSFDEIAHRTGASPGALYARKNRIRLKLTACAEAAGWFDDRQDRGGRASG